MKFKRLLPFAALVLGALSACSGKGGGQSEEKVVDIASIVAPQDGKNVFIGGVDRIQSDGWLDRELAKKGWKVRWVPVPPAVGGPVVNEGFAAKTIDIALYGDLPAVIAMAGGVDLKLLTTTGSGSNIYVAVGAKSTAQSLQDLKGKRIALHRGRPWEAGFARYAESQGLKLEDFKIINTNVLAGTAALTSGKVDAIVLIQAEAYVLEEKGLARVLWSTRDAPESWKMLGGTFARTEFLKAHPDIAQTVITAIVRQSRWTSDEANKTAVIQWGTAFGAPLGAVEKDVANSRLSWRERASPIPGKALQDHFTYVADYAAKTKVTPTRVDVSTLIDRRYVDKAIDELGLKGWWQDPPPGA
jgi:sulfonate transport system substrate-binding protein